MARGRGRGATISFIWREDREVCEDEGPPHFSQTVGPAGQGRRHLVGGEAARERAPPISEATSHSSKTWLGSSATSPFSTFVIHASKSAQITYDVRKSYRAIMAFGIEDSRWRAARDFLYLVSRCLGFNEFILQPCFFIFS